MPKIFVEPEIRIKWAGKKLDELKDLIRLANDETNEFAIREREMNGMRMLFRFQDQTHYESIRLVSEFLHHGRSALDYIVFNLARHNTGTEQDRTQYPICDCQKEFEEVVRRKRSPIEFLTEDQVVLVERFQPYNRLPVLALFNRISNRDKHREFHISASEGLRRLVPVAEVQASGRRGIPSDQVGMEFLVSYDVLLDDGMPATETLKQLHSLLGRILNEFNTLLGP
ncbi:MAG TPA: hypothetical protein VKV03_02560 [Candidatus Binataceae bacterium]|nr:hypothetical protein [Candidatus Binataceae bacterium]